MSNTANIHASIAVFRGDPLDFQKFRHVAIWLQFQNDTSITIHLTGATRDYRIETMESYNPRGSDRIVREIPMGWLNQRMTKAQIVGFLYQTPVDNTSTEFNCQTWVGDALNRMVRGALISQAVADTALDGMVDAILEAREEP